MVNELHKKSIERSNEIIEKELDDLLINKRQNNTSWDNHILTLSTAALGFTFTFLPIAEGRCITYIYIGSLAFVLSILFATINYSLADMSSNSLLKNLMERWANNLKVEKEYTRMEEAIHKHKNNEEKLTASKILYHTNVQELMEELEKILDDTETKNRKYSKGITALNHLKTIAFIVGIMSVLVYSFENVELLGYMKGK